MKGEILKESRVIHIPTSNVLTTNGASIDVLRLFAKRPKLYTFFHRLHAMALDINLDYQTKEYTPLLKGTEFYVKELLQYDVWTVMSVYPELEELHAKLVEIRDKGCLVAGRSVEMEEMYRKEWKIDSDIALSEHEINTVLGLISVRIHSIWNSGRVVSKFFDRQVRSKYLPI